MQINFRESQDFWAGVMLIAIGAGTILIARNYQFGSAVRMGPGYFPTVLGGILAAVGRFFVVKALRSAEKIEPGWSLRALIVIPVALVLFGVMMSYAGFIPALVVLIFGSALASSEFRPVEVLLLSIGLTAACVAVFIWGLGLPYPLIAEF